MKIRNPRAITQCRERAAGICEHCRRWVGFGHVHHIRGKGMGGGSRIDHVWNLIFLCVFCHLAVHLGKILRCTLLALVAAREGCLQHEITAEIDRLLRETK